jgi:hypothetical protein
MCYCWGDMLMKVIILGNVAVFETRHDLLLRVKKEQKSKMLKQLQHAVECGNKFISMVSHELRTPIHGIMGLVDEARGGDKEQRMSACREKHVTFRLEDISARADDPLSHVSTAHLTERPTGLSQLMHESVSTLSCSTHPSSNSIVDRRQSMVHIAYASSFYAGTLPRSTPHSPLLAKTVSSSKQGSGYSAPLVHSSKPQLNLDLDFMYSASTSVYSMPSSPGESSPRTSIKSPDYRRPPYTSWLGPSIRRRDRRGCATPRAAGLRCPQRGEARWTWSMPSSPGESTPRTSITSPDYHRPPSNNSWLGPGTRRRGGATPRTSIESPDYRIPPYTSWLGPSIRRTDRTGGATPRAAGLSCPRGREGKWTWWCPCGGRGPTANSTKRWQTRSSG